MKCAGPADQIAGMVWIIAMIAENGFSVELLSEITWGFRKILHNSSKSFQRWICMKAIWFLRNIVVCKMLNLSFSMLSLEIKNPLRLSVHIVLEETDVF